MSRGNGFDDVIKVAEPAFTSLKSRGGDEQFVAVMS